MSSRKKVKPEEAKFNPYILFLHQFKKVNPELNPDDLMRLGAQAWKTLRQRTKEAYNLIAKSKMRVWAGGPQTVSEALLDTTKSPKRLKNRAVHKIVEADQPDKPAIEIKPESECPKTVVAAVAAAAAPPPTPAVREPEPKPVDDDSSSESDDDDDDDDELKQDKQQMPPYPNVGGVMGFPQGYNNNQPNRNFRPQGGQQPPGQYRMPYCPCPPCHCGPCGPWGPCGPYGPCSPYTPKGLRMCRRWWPCWN